MERDNALSNRGEPKLCPRRSLGGVTHESQVHLQLLFYDGFFGTAGVLTVIRNIAWNLECQSTLPACSAHYHQRIRAEDLVGNQNCIISAIPESRVIRQFKIKAFIFFIVFVFFSIVSVHSSYPIVKKSFQDWKKYKPPLQFK